MENVLKVALSFWETLGQMAPYLLIGFFVAGLLSVMVSPELIQKHLGGRGIWPVIKASLFGVPLPLCSCSVIPVAISLSRHGSSKGATTAFLLSTPQTGVDSIMATYSLLGPVFAIFRPVAAFVAGLVGGGLVDAFEKADKTVQTAAERSDDCCELSRKQNWLVRVLHHGFVVLPRDIGRPMVIGLIVAGIITVLIPKGHLSGVAGTGIAPMLVMMAIGIPIYVCATASVPIAAAMIVAGVSPGAALVFLMTGPATNAAALAAVWKVMGRRTALIYLGATAGTALASGLLLDLIITPTSIATGICSAHAMLPSWVEAGSAVLLSGILGAGVLRIGQKYGNQNNEDHTGPATRFKVAGMTCQHCAESVRTAILKVPGVLSARVSLTGSSVEVSGLGFDPAKIKDEVHKAGYSLSEDDAGRKSGQ
ncbi:MAG: SO_0444 family Cu/Zn efflux transporter [bacterium]